MFIKKNIGRLVFTLRTRHPSNFNIIQIGVSTFFGKQLSICLLNVNFIIYYMSKKEEKNFADMCAALSDSSDKWDDWDGLE